jgi:hypothetical protein
MSKRLPPSRQLWEDRFSAPSADGLFAALPAPSGPALSSLRKTLASEYDYRETLGWRGLPWRWTLSYTPAGSRHEQEPVAHIVPNPAAPTVIFRLSHEGFGELPIRKLSRYVREGLAQAKLVAGVCWPEWTVHNQAQVTDLTELFRLLRQGTLAGA